MVNRLPSWIFLSLAMLIMGAALLPLLRAAIGIDEYIEMPYFVVVSLLIGGLMCGLTAMLLLVRRQPVLKTYFGNVRDKTAASMIHATGLLIFTGIPLINFLACYYYWVKWRSQSEYLDRHGREAICFQITIYLYLLMCLFMAYIAIGALAIPLILFFHLAATTLAIINTLRDKTFRYPANITIIDRK